MEKIEYNSSLSRAYAMRLGLVVAGFWVSSFLCAMYGDKFPLVGLMQLPLGIMTVFVVGKHVGTMASKLEGMKARHMFVTCLMTFFFATLLTTLAQYVYFAYLDHGMMVERMMTAMEMPEMQELMEAWMGEVKQEEVIELMSVPMNMVSMSFMMNIYMSLFLSLPSLLYAVFYRRRGLS